jgi:hypothetical protein
MSCARLTASAVLSSVAFETTTPLGEGAGVALSAVASVGETPEEEPHAERAMSEMEINH